MIQIEIADQVINTWAHFPSFRIEEGIAARGDTMSGELVIPQSDLDVNVSKPRPGNVARLLVNGVEEFEGVVQRVSDEFVNPTTMRVTLDCIDYTAFIDRHLVVKQEYPSEAAGERVKRILNEFAPDFTDDSFIEKGMVIPEQGYDYEPPSSVLDQLAEATGYHWYVDFDRRIHFFAREEFQNETLSERYNNIVDLDANPEIGGVRVDEDISQLHNVVIIKDFSQRSDVEYRDTQVSDGQQSFFKLPMPPWSLDDTQVRVSKDNGQTWQERVLEIDPLDGSPETIDGVPGRSYLCVFNWGIRFPLVDLPDEGDIIETTYRYELPERAQAWFDLDSIEEMKRREGTGDGQHQVMISLPDFRVKTMKVLDLYAQMVLERQAWPKIQGTFETFMPNWHAGQTFHITSQVRDIYDIRRWVKTGRGDKIPETVWVHRARKRIVTTRDGETVLQTRIDFANVPFPK